MPDFPFKPNRWPEQARQENRIWRDVRSAWSPIEKRVWEVIGLTPGGTVTGGRAVRGPGDVIPGFGNWGEAEWAVFDKLADDFTTELLGKRVMSGAAYADPNNEQAILAVEGRTGFAVGVDRAVQITAAGESMLGERAELATRKLLEEGFDRLGEGGQLRPAIIPAAASSRYWWRPCARGRTR